MTIIEHPDIPAEPPWAPIATQALHLAQREQYDQAARVVERLAREYGSDTVITAMLAWIDAALRIMAPLRPAGAQPVAVQFVQVVSDPDTVPSRVPEHVEWAGRALIARWRDDVAQFQLLIDGVVDDESWSTRVMAVLTLSARNLNVALQGNHPEQYRSGRAAEPSAGDST